MAIWTNILGSIEKNKDLAWLSAKKSFWVLKYYYDSKNLSVLLEEGSIYYNLFTQNTLSKAKSLIAQKNNKI